MKAIYYHGPGKLELIEIPVPAPGTGEVLVKVKYCGICGTDIHAYQMEGIFDWELVLGHEAVGVVEAIGEGVTCVKAGDRVAIGPPGDCGDCYSCNMGNSNTCPNGLPNTLVIGPNTQGAYAEYILSKNPKNELIHIPDNVAMEDAVLFDLLGVGFHAVRRSELRAGDSAIVSGCGSIGLSAIQFAKLSGASPLIAFAPRQISRDLAIKCGADYALDPANEKDIEKAKDILAYTSGAQVCFEAAGAPDSVETCVSLCMPSGQVILIGNDGRPYPLVTAALGPRQIDLKFSFTYLREEIVKMFDLMRCGKLDVSPYTRVKKPLSEAISVLDALAYKKLSAARVLLMPN